MKNIITEDDTELWSRINNKKIESKNHSMHNTIIVQDIKRQQKQQPS